MAQARLTLCFIPPLNFCTASLRRDHMSTNDLLDPFDPVDFAAFTALLAKAKGIVCSRGRHMGESCATSMKIPCISSCVGATERISTGQTIVIDSGRGEVYDASLLHNLR